MRKLPVIRPRPTRPDAGYYSRLWREAGAYRVNMARKRWCDLSHEHFDWKVSATGVGATDDAIWRCC